jgi:hypothetical protein
MSRRVDPYLADVEQWTRQAFALDPGIVVRVYEEALGDDAGSRVETVIVLDRPAGPEEHRLHLPVDRVSPAHLWQLAAGDHGCCR